MELSILTLITFLVGYALGHGLPHRPKWEKKREHWEEWDNLFSYDGTNKEEDE